MDFNFQFPIPMSHIKMRFSLEDCATVLTIVQYGHGGKKNMINANQMSLTMNDTVTVVMVALGMAVLALLYLRGPATVGLELEVIRKERSGPISRLAEYLRRKTGRDETRYMGYTHSHVDNLKIVDDGSLSGGGVEVVTPVMPVKDRSLLTKICDALRGIATTDASTGVHAHVGVIDRDDFGDYGPTWSEDDDNWAHLNGWLGRILVAYSHFEQAIGSFLSPSRRGRNDVHGGDRVSSLISRIATDIMYSLDGHDGGHVDMSNLQLLPKSKVHSIYQYLTGQGRYYKVNLVSIRKYGTVEFRQHQGSINPIHLNAWVDLVVAMTTASRMPWTDSARDPTSYRSNLDGLWAWLGVNPNSQMASVLSRRQRRFSGSLHEDEFCTNCGSSQCDRDDYCPTTAGSWMDNDTYVDVITEDEVCGGCGYTNCECGSVSLVGMWMAMLAPFVLIVGCGIGAYHAVGRKFGMKKNLRSIRSLFTGLTSRGKAAAGFALRSLSGKNPNNGESIDTTHTWVLKDSVSAHILAPRMDDLLDKQTQLVLLHTRLPTDGANTKRNAHPHRDPQTGKTITLVHNGMVWDHEKSFPKGVKPDTECDSEVIAAQMYEGGIEAVVKHLQGSMALLWHDNREAGVINAWRNDGNPLHFSRLDDSRGPVVFASTEKHLKDAYGKRLVKVYSCVEGRHYKVYPDGTITHEDIAGSEYTYYTRYKRSNWIDISSIDDYDSKWNDWDKPTDKHTYDSENHQGVRPDGTTYDLPHNVDPLLDEMDMIDLENGHWDLANPKAANLYGSGFYY